VFVVACSSPEHGEAPAALARRAQPKIPSTQSPAQPGIGSADAAQGSSALVAASAHEERERALLAEHFVLRALELETSASYASRSEPVVEGGADAEPTRSTRAERHAHVLAELRARHAAWKARAPNSYVFVLQEEVMARTVNTLSLRVSVRDGEVVEARSLLWGGSPPLASARSINALFDTAEQMAMLGQRGIPHRFAIEYDARYGYVRDVRVDGRATIADDESGFRVLCFSMRASGCDANLLTREQCLQGGGTLIDAGGEQSCPDNGWSVGLVGDHQVCCRTYSERGHDDLDAAQCKALGGREHGCSADEVTVGYSASRHTGCCRRHIRRVGAKRTRGETRDRSAAR
jgi:hypothetical protein